MTKVGDYANLTMNLTRGDVCFYKLKNSCGRVKVDLTRVDNSDNGVTIEYLEFEKG